MILKFCVFFVHGLNATTKLILATLEKFDLLNKLTLNPGVRLLDVFSEYLNRFFFVSQVVSLVFNQFTEVFSVLEELLFPLVLVLLALPQ